MTQGTGTPRRRWCDEPLECIEGGLLPRSGTLDAFLTILFHYWEKVSPICFHSSFCEVFSAQSRIYASTKTTRCSLLPHAEGAGFAITTPSVIVLQLSKLPKKRNWHIKKWKKVLNDIKKILILNKKKPQLSIVPRNTRYTTWRWFSAAAHETYRTVRLLITTRTWQLQ